MTAREIPSPIGITQTVLPECSKRQNTYPILSDSPRKNLAVDLSSEVKPCLTRMDSHSGGMKDLEPPVSPFLSRSSAVTGLFDSRADPNPRFFGISSAPGKYFFASAACEL